MGAKLHLLLHGKIKLILLHNTYASD
jgi:hypothetical protein